MSYVTWPFHRCMLFYSQDETLDLDSCFAISYGLYLGSPQESHRSHEYERLRWTHPEYALGALSRNIRYRGVMPPGGTPHDYAVA